MSALIKKERIIPWKIRKLEALLRRLPPSYPDRIKMEEQLAISYAGYRGETSIDYHLSLLPQDSCYILHDLRLPGEQETYFQIDTLLITPHFLLLLEIKNMAGTLYFDRSFHQIIRTLHDKEEAFPDPLLQLQRQQNQLEKWLKRHKLPQVPVLGYVVISNSSAILKTDPNHRDVYHTVIRSLALPSKFASLQQKFNAVSLQKNQIQKISRQLKKNHNELVPDLPYEVDKQLISPGVYCPICFQLPLPRKRGGWYCTACNTVHAKAHLPTLIDYFLLHKNTITNKECRTFLKLDSPSTASKLLRSLDLPVSGSYKNRTYFLQLKLLQ